MAPSTVPISDLEFAVTAAAAVAAVVIVVLVAALLVGALFELAIHFVTVGVLRLRHRKRPR